MRSFVFFALFFIAQAAHAAIGNVLPARACNFLAGNGFPTSTWRQQADGKYRCSSPRIDIGTVAGKNGRMNNVSYAAEGDARSVARLYLTIDVDNPEQSAAIHRRLKDVAIALARRLDIELPDALQKAIADGGNSRIALGEPIVAVTRTDRPAGGYEVRVVFE
jgi:hypothetical protein